MNSVNMERVKEELFVSLSLMRDAKEGRREDVVRGASASEIYHYVMGGEVNGVMDAKISDDQGSSELYRQFIEAHARFYIPQAAAASSDQQLMSRESNEGVVRLIPSRTEPEQIYLVVEFRYDRKGKERARLTVFGKEGEQAHIQLTGIAAGRCQLLMKRDTALIQLLQQVDSELFIV